MEYHKRPGTFGIDGNFFESKFLSLVLIRLQKDVQVADFSLASNMDGVGDFDDMCLKINIAERDQPLALYVQLKHKDDIQKNKDENERNNERFAMLNMDKADLIKYINSFLLIKDNITLVKKNKFYENMSVAESVFILYTNAELKLTGSALTTKELYIPFKSSCNTIVNGLLASSDTFGRQLQCPEQLEQDLARDLLEADLIALAKRFASHLSDRTEHIVDMENDRYMRRYHVVLKKTVLNVSDIKTGNNGSKWRTLTFRQDFFESQVCEHMEVFRRTLIEEIWSKHPKNSRASNNEANALSTPEPLTSTSVDELIASFLSEQSANTLSPLIATHIACDEEGKLRFLVNRPERDMEQLARISIPQQMIAEALLRSLKLKVPVKFGNVLYKKLEEKIKQRNDGTNDLHEYRFDVKSDKFPKLNYLECTDADHNLPEADLVKLAERFATYLSSDKTGRAQNLLKDVILKMKVVHVGDIVTGDNNLKWRILNFQDEFFESEVCKHIEIFRKTLFNEILKRHPKISNRALESVTDDPSTSHASLIPTPSVDELIASFLSEKSALTLSRLIGTYIDHNEDGKLDFLIKRHEQDVEQLRCIKISQQTIAEALLLSLTLRVSVDFGNVDLLVNNKKRLEHLVTTFVDLCKQCEPLDSPKIITIDDTLPGGLLSHSGGLASGVDNILTFDEKTKLLKFAHNYAPEQKNAQSLYEKLIDENKNNKINNLHEYRFNIKTDKLPKLRLDCTDTVREFFSKLVVYEKQSNQFKLEGILKQEIQERLWTDTDYCLVSSQSVLLHYHQRVLKWMRLENYCLNKNNNFYEQAKKNVKAAPVISALHSTFCTSNQRYFQYSFSEAAIDEMKLPTDLSKVFIVSGTVTLTTKKVIQWLRKHDATNNHVVLDLQSVFGLQNDQFCSLKTELKETKEVIIMVWNNIKSNTDTMPRGFKSLADATSHLRLFLVTNSELGDSERGLFTCSNIINRTETESLCAMASRERIQNDTQVIFQGSELQSKLILDDKSASYVIGDVLDDIIRNQTISIGASLSNSRYEDIKHYIDRRVSWVSEFPDYIYFLPRTYRINMSDYPLTSFLDIEDDVVLLTAPPGMGKSTLVTHLSLNTKDLDREMVLWIVRVNFEEYTEQFRVWHHNKTHVSDVELLKFMCQVIIENNTILFDVELNENGEACLVTSSADGLLSFQLKLFLHFYNQMRLIFVFDGFDEICPDHEKTVIKFLIAAKRCTGKMKMWVTSRPYSDILPELRKVLGRGLQIEHLSYAEQESYLRQYWIEHLQVSNVNTGKLDALLTFIYQSEPREDAWIQFVCCVYADAASQYNCPSTLTCTKLKELLKYFRTKKPLAVLSGIPIILYFIAEYFINLLDVDKHPGTFNLNINLRDIYQMFIKNKILSFFKDENNLDHFKPKGRVMYDDLLAASVSTHKQIAAYHLIQKALFRKLDYEEFKYMKLIRDDKYAIELTKIRKGKNKIGLISHVTRDNVPVFIHRSLMEYLAAEYACDVLTDNELDIDQKVHWYCAISEYCGEAVNEWINLKRKTDIKLKQVFKQIKQPSRIYAMKYENFLSRDNLSGGQFIRILASSIHNYNNGLFDVPLTHDPVLEEIYIEYLKGYNISRMKPNLQKYFGGPAFFTIDRHAFAFVRLFIKDKSEEVLNLYSTYIKVRTVGHRLSIPLLLRLEDNSTDDALSIKNNSSSVHFNDTSSQEDNENGFVYISLDDIKRNYRLVLDKLLERTDDEGRALNILLEATNTVRCPLYYTEQHVEQLADSLFSMSVSFFTDIFFGCYYQSHKEGYPLSLNMEHIMYPEIFAHRVISVHNDVIENRYNRSQVMMLCDDFLDSDDTDTARFRNYFINPLVNNRSGILHLKDLPSDELISSFFSKPSAATLTPLIGAYIVLYNDDKLAFNNERSPEDEDRLRRLNIPPSTIEESMVAVRTAATEYLRSLHMRVDTALDVINYMSMTPMIDFLCEQYEQVDSYKVITKNKMIKDWKSMNLLFNLLINDEKTNMLKFRSHFPSEQDYIKNMFEELNKRVDNLYEYRFQVLNTTSSRLHLYCTDVARTFLSKLVIYADQGNYYKMEAVLQNERDYSKHIGIRPFRSHLALLHYYSELLKWSMPEGTAPCRYDSAFYKQALDNIRAEPLIIDLFTQFYVKNLRYTNFSFDECTTKWIKLLDLPLRTAIFTDVVTLTAVEVMQYLRERDSIQNYAILDLKYVYNISTEQTLRSLCTELRKSQRAFIIVWYNTQEENDVRNLREVAEAVKDRQLVVIGNSESKTRIYEYFKFEYELQNSLAKDLQKEILQVCKVSAQGEEVTLDLILDDKSVEFVNGCMLEKVIRGESVSIGAPLSDSHYDEVRGMYIDRSVSATDNADHVRLVNTFHDIADDLVLLTAPPGMGKSTLLTHLSVKTKQHDIKFWIVRVNFIDHLEQFKKWDSDEVVVDTQAVLQFLCCVILKKKNISSYTITGNGEVDLQNYAGDELVTLQLKMFFHIYNQRRLILAFDGFDEICPRYKDIGLTFLTAASTLPLINKMWVTSRPYRDILPDLERVLGTGYKLQTVNDNELYVKCVAREEVLIDMFDNEGLEYLLRYQDILRDSFKNDDAETRELSDVLKLRIERIPLTEVHKLSGTSLLLYVLTDYLVNVINIYETHSDSEQRVELRVIYQTFVEDKLGDMLFQDEDDLGESGARELIIAEIRQFIELDEKLKLRFNSIRLPEYDHDDY